MAKACKLKYEKSSQHRVINANGAWATIAPSGSVQVAVFSDLSSLPPATTVNIFKNSTLIPGDTEEPLEILREVEATLLMHPDVAHRLVELLTYVLEKNDAERSKDHQ